MKISIVGASGKVGREALKGLLLGGVLKGHELVLIAQNTNRISGILADIRSAALMGSQLLGKTYTEPKIVISKDYEHTQNSDLIVVCAGIWPSSSLKEEFKKTDPSGRLVQSYVNQKLVKDIASNISKYSNDPSIIMLTNQSDMMSEVARDALPNAKVYGMGGMIDSSRLRVLLARDTGFPLSAFEKGNHMVGYHNDSMFLLRSSLTVKIDHDKAERIQDEVRNYGAHVSSLQKDFNFPSMNSGASVLPGLALAATVAAFGGHSQPITESFTIHTDERSSCHYGTPVGKAISVPVVISEGEIMTSTEYPISEDEKKLLISAQQKFYKDYASLKLA